MRSPIPIAVFLSSFESGAATRQVIDVARHLNRERFDVHLACLDPRRASMDGIAASARPTIFPIEGLPHPSAVREARHFGRWCRERGIAVVHAAGYRAEVFALPAAAFAGVPVRVATRLTVGSDRGTAQLALRRAAYACAQRLTARTASIAAQLAREHVADRHVRVITEGIDAITYGLTDALTAARPPITLRNAVKMAAPRPVLLIAAGGVADETRAGRYMQRGSPGNVELWTVPNASHTGGLAASPREWETRVSTFLDRALAPAAG